MSSPFNSLLGMLGTTDPYRSRPAWNDRFTHWERSESDSETQRIERARSMVEDALGQSAWLRSQGVKIVPQGSFTNRTNTRLEADIDLRVQHPMLKVEYDHGVEPQQAWAAGGYYPAGATYGEVSDAMRQQLGVTLMLTFGSGAVDMSGKKAIRVNGLDGSRAEVDVVPAFTLHKIGAGSLLTGFTTVQGVAILSGAGWTYNFPDQHIANGRAKRLRTGYQFKKVVRIVKRLRADMADRGIYTAKVPSFLIECLIYLVEDDFFVVSVDDRYGRVRRILQRLASVLAVPLAPYYLREINGVKLLFETGQSWTHQSAVSFIDAALLHLGDA